MKHTTHQSIPESLNVIGGRHSADAQNKVEMSISLAKTITIIHNTDSICNVGLTTLGDKKFLLVEDLTHGCS